ncbi:FUSC family protein [Cysteiniphilum marinum]|uniref:FUSC family protein n=1 Tax=Cysteiniphilum marinum TaxID=2774191 RepID=UPI00193AAE14|nr:FUSC family protein [Cysteiniphilum marinum]
MMEKIFQWRFLYLSLEASFIALICFFIGDFLGGLVYGDKMHIGGLWCMISALVVLQSIASDTLKSSKSRVIGTVIASIVSGIVCVAIGYGYLAIALSIGLCAYIMHSLKENDGVRIATATSAMITGFGLLNPDYSAVVNAIMRSVDTLVGVGFSVLVVYISYKLKIRHSK